MILYKNNPEQTRLHNIFGSDYIIESQLHYVHLSVIRDTVDSIHIEDRIGMKKPAIEEYETALAECYEVVAFAQDIRAIVGRKLEVDRYGKTWLHKERR
jgi:hypothetical protein